MSSGVKTPPQFVEARLHERVTPGHAPSQWRNYRQCSRGATETHACGGVGPEHTWACPHCKRAPGDEDNIDIYRNINNTI